MVSRWSPAAVLDDGERACEMPAGKQNRRRERSQRPALLLAPLPTNLGATDASNASRPPQPTFLRVTRHPPGTVLLHLQKANGLGVPVGFTPDDVKRTSQECVPERRFWTTGQRISDQFLDAYDTGGGVVSCSGMAPQLRTAWRELHRPLRIGNPNA